MTLPAANPRIRLHLPAAELGAHHQRMEKQDAFEVGYMASSGRTPPCRRPCTSSGSRTASGSCRWVFTARCTATSVASDPPSPRCWQARSGSSTSTGTRPRHRIGRPGRMASDLLPRVVHLSGVPGRRVESLAVSDQPAAAASGRRRGYIPGNRWIATGEVYYTDRALWTDVFTEPSGVTPRRTAGEARVSYRLRNGPVRSG